MPTGAILHRAIAIVDFTVSTVAPGPPKTIDRPAIRAARPGMDAVEVGLDSGVDGSAATVNT